MYSDQEMPDDTAQRILRAELANRHQRAKQGLYRINRELTDLAVPVVLREFNPQAVTDGAVTFAASLTPDQADAWLRCYTRTVFFFGNPRNLAARQPVPVCAGDNSVGWLGLVDREWLTRLRRLLRPVTGVLPAMSLDLSGGASPVPPPGAQWCLWLAVRDLDLAQYLVHLHHTVAEAVLTGKVRSCDKICLRHVEDLHPSRIETQDCIYARVQVSHNDPERVRLYAVLCGQG